MTPSPPPRPQPPGAADTVRSLGEFATIDRAVAGRIFAPGTVVGPGDDAAVLTVTDNRVVASTDMLVEGQHFRLDWSTPWQIGRKAIAQNAADIVSMGATPLSFLVALGCPAETSIAFVDELTGGLWEEAREVGADISGGDMVRSEGVVISITALGVLHGRPPVLRSGARPGDLLALAGRLGWSAGGFALLTAQDDPGGIPEPVAAALLQAHRVPCPPYRQGTAAAGAGATSMTDISDGLIADLRHLAAASSVAIEVDSSRLQVAEELRVAAGALGADPLEWVLTGGEDHALAATFPVTAQLPVGWRVVGRVAEGRDVWVDGALRGDGGGWRSWG